MNIEVTLVAIAFYLLFDLSIKWHESEPSDLINLIEVI